MQIAVLDAKITVLYVEGYPRWEYRYIKNEMIRDKTVDISCLLTSADPTFRQEGDKPITRVPREHRRDAGRTTSCSSAMSIRGSSPMRSFSWSTISSARRAAGSA